MPLSSSLDRFLATMEYPATRDDLLREARRDGLSTDDCAALADLPDQSYNAAWYIRARLARRALTDAMTAATPVAV